MNINDFNSKINLPYFCSSNGLKNLDFVKIVPFGWFAYTPDLTEIRSLLDFIPANDIAAFCMQLIQDKTKYHEFKITYNEIALKKLINSIRIYKTFNSLLIDAQHELETGEIYEEGNYRNLKNRYIEDGCEPFLATGIGLITEGIYEKYKAPLGLSKSVMNKVIIPTYCTPTHPCSYEVFSSYKETARTPVYVNGEKGWYGKLNGNLLGSFELLKVQEGFLWDHKCDYWATSPVKIDHSVDTNQCLQLWAESKNTKFIKSPLDIIEENQSVSQVKLFLSRYNLTQISKLEERFGIELVTHWKNQTVDEIKVGNLKFIKKDNRYFVELRNGCVEEFTNFTVTIEKIIKKNNLFYRIGYFTFGNTDYSFELENSKFLSIKTLLKTINTFFLEHGMGLPLILTNYQCYLLDIINRFNKYAEFQIENKT